jgi:hypothetical protein
LGWLWDAPPVLTDCPSKVATPEIVTFPVTPSGAIAEYLKWDFLPKVVVEFLFIEP